MAKISAEITSKDMIKPKSETPNQLKTLQLSLVDQFAPFLHMPIIIFYQTPLDHNNTNTIQILKNSLSETLVQFYPLAGRIQGNSSIDCNDEGVGFYEADVLETMSEIIANPDPEELIKLLPYAPLSGNNSIVTGVQLNRFSCGGIAIGVSISHKVVDGATYAAFVNTWARNARGGVVSKDGHHHPPPTFGYASVFPPMDLDGVFDPEASISKEKTVTRRLVFDKEKLVALKKQCVDGTKTELVSGFIWKKLIKIAKSKLPTPPKIFFASQLVNLRTVKKSPIPRNAGGNLFWYALVDAEIEPEIEYSEAVGKLRPGVKQIDTSYLEKIKTGECLAELQNVFQSISQGEAEFCAFTSLIRFPQYEVDFGWGAPLWISFTAVPTRNTIFLLNTKCGHGIEAWVTLPEQDVAMLEQEDEDEDDHESSSLQLPKKIQAML